MTKALEKTPPDFMLLHEYIEQSLQRYFNELDGHEPTNLHALVLEAIEIPLLKASMQRFASNQTRVANTLGISRSTLRKKLKQYNIK